jgi:aconitate hydratase 2/2-methylisocitrate dehydratase
VELLTYRVPAGVDDAAKVKAEFLAKVAKGELACGLVSKVKATELLGTMLGGYNVKPLIDLLGDAETGAAPPKASRRPCWSSTSSTTSPNWPRGNANAKAVMQSWADGEWFTSRPEVPPARS